MNAAAGGLKPRRRLKPAPHSSKPQNGRELELGRGRHRVGQPLGLRRPPRPACSQPSQIPRGQASLRGLPQPKWLPHKSSQRAKNSKLSSTVYIDTKTNAVGESWTTLWAL